MVLLAGKKFTNSFLPSRLNDRESFLKSLERRETFLAIFWTFLKESKLTGCGEYAVDRRVAFLVPVKSDQ